MIHLLGRCNLTCGHCYMGGSPTRTEELPVDAVVDAVSSAADLDIGSLYLTGGEPLLYRHLSTVLQAGARVAGLEITVCTNGTRVRARDATAWAALGVKANVSIDGPPDCHDQLRASAGAFGLAERGITALVSAGVPVTVVSTLTTFNLHSLSWTAAWCRSHGVQELRVQPLLKLGRGLAIADGCLTGPDLDALLLALSDLANRHRDAGFKCSLVGVTRRFLTAHPCGAYVCNGGGCHRRVAKEIKKIVVRENGQVLPEITNLDGRFALGRLGDRPLTEMVAAFFDDGYAVFDQLCRQTYAEVLPSWKDPVVPWDQIVAERSSSWQPGTWSPGDPAEPTACETRAGEHCALGC